MPSPTTVATKDAQLIYLTRGIEALKVLYKSEQITQRVICRARSALRDAGVKTADLDAWITAEGFVEVSTHAVQKGSKRSYSVTNASGSGTASIGQRGVIGLKAGDRVEAHFGNGFILLAPEGKTDGVLDLLRLGGVLEETKKEKPNGAARTTIKRPSHPSYSY